MIEKLLSKEPMPIDLSLEAGAALLGEISKTYPGIRDYISDRTRKADKGERSEEEREAIDKAHDVLTDYSLSFKPVIAAMLAKVHDEVKDEKILEGAAFAFIADEIMVTAVVTAFYLEIKRNAHMMITKIDTDGMDPLIKMIFELMPPEAREKAIATSAMMNIMHLMLRNAENVLYKLIDEMFPSDKKGGPKVIIG